MSRILVVAPHPDDETLGCGGTLLKHRKDNDEINWLIMTEMKPNNSNRNFIEKRNNEIKKVKKIYDFETVIQADFETAMLDSYNISEIINFIFVGVRHPTVSAKLNLSAPEFCTKVPILIKKSSSVRLASSAVNLTFNP